MLLLLVIALACGLTATIASLIQQAWFAAVGFLGVVILAVAFLAEELF